VCSKETEPGEIERKAAVAEQLRSGFPIPEKGADEKKSRQKEMLYLPRGRRTESLFVDMIDQILKAEDRKQKQPPKKNRRKRRHRKPKILVT
jgi:hypothetical protein